MKKRGSENKSADHFVFAYAKSRFSHDAAHWSFVCSAYAFIAYYVLRRNKKNI